MLGDPPDLGEVGRAETGDGVGASSIGETKATRLDLPDLARLDRITDLLAGSKRVSPAPTIKRLLFSLDGFTTDLSEAAHRRHDVELVDLHRLYEGD